MYNPLEIARSLYPKRVALLGDGFSLTYEELYDKVGKYTPSSPIFYAPPLLESILHFFALLQKKATPCPISPREPLLPSLSLPNGYVCLATSGTTNIPKLVLHTLESLFYNASFPHPDLILKEGDHWLLSLPLNHVGGLQIVFRSFVSGAALVLPEVKKPPITHLSAVPTQLKRLLQLEETPYPNLKALVLGGAPIPLELCEQAYKKEIPLYLTYGMTEMASQVATHPFHPSSGVTFGSPLPHREIKIHEDGEILIRGKTSFTGYLNRPTPFLEDGWFPTKDLGQMTPIGLTLLGRKDRMIISGGENIHLEELESTALALPHILYAKASKRADETFGERPLLTLYTDRPLQIELLQELLKASLPSFKVPYLSDIELIQGPPPPSKGDQK